jgi:hypothetical protein
MKFDSKGKKKVGEDWNGQFLPFQIWKPAHLIKRHGPLLIGICLDGDRANDNYTPKAHFHNLCIPFPVVSLGLVGELERNGIPRRISLDKHDGEYRVAADELRGRYPFLLKERLGFNDFIEATSNYLSGKHGRMGQVPFQHAPFEGIVTVAAYMGQVEYARAALDDFSKRMSQWPQRGLNIIGSVAQWSAKMNSVISASGDLVKVVSDQIVEHKLDGIVDHGMYWPEVPATLR